MKSLSIAWKDLQVLFNDRGALVQMFLLPMVFILIMSVAQAGMSRTAEPKRVALPVVNLDAGGQMSQRLLDEIHAAGGLAVVPYEQAAADEALADGAIRRVLVIPAGFTADLAASRQPTLRLVNHPKADAAETRSVLEVVTGVARDLSLKNYLLASLRQVGDMQAASPTAGEVFSTERIMAQAEAQFSAAQARPLITVEQMTPVAITAARGEVNNALLAVPGFAILFIFLTAQGTARSVYDERKSGSFRRLRAAPLSKTEVLLGKMLPNFILGVLQAAVIFGLSAILMPLLGVGRLAVGDQWLGFIVLTLAIALCSTALGVLIAAIARTENQIGGGSSLILWMAGALGGAFFPLFLLGGLWDAIGKVVPHYWSLRGYYDLLLRGQGLAGITTEVGALLAFTAAFFAAGLLKFDYD